MLMVKVRVPGLGLTPNRKLYKIIDIVMEEK